MDLRTPCYFTKTYETTLLCTLIITKKIGFDNTKMYFFVIKDSCDYCFKVRYIYFFMHYNERGDI